MLKIIVSSNMVSLDSLLPPNSTNAYMNDNRREYVQSGATRKYDNIEALPPIWKVCLF
jgi:hypothetical protein